LSDPWFIGVDIGGTFTDVVAIRESDGLVRHLKVPSSTEEPGAAVVSAIRMLEPTASRAPTVRLLLHGTTVVTNAIIQRNLARTALVTTKGFKDVLEIGRHWRRELYDPFLVPSPPLVPRDLRYEVRERLDAQGKEVAPLDVGSVQELRRELRRSRVEAVAVVFLHSYRNPVHEEQMAAALRRDFEGVVVTSSELSREFREYERTSTTVLNASLIPLTDQYVTRLESEVQADSGGAKLLMTQSNGGALTPTAARRRPVSVALSGPVAGVVACSELARLLGNGRVIGLDMGGTSTDVSVIVGGLARFTNELLIGEMVVRLPSIEINSIGAGGGSIAGVDLGGALRVGPESAGAEPGPACYGRGGRRPTVTDCQLVLGRLSEDTLLAGRLRLYAGLARDAVQEQVASPLGLGLAQAAAGVIEVVTAAMEGAVRVALRRHGDDPRDFSIVAFGGAGPLHAVELARRLGIQTVIVPPHPGTFSAYGVLASDIRLDFARSEVHVADESDLRAIIVAIYSELESQALAEIAADAGLEAPTVTMSWSCDMRYRGQAYEVTIPLPNHGRSPDLIAEMVDDFHSTHARTFGFSNPGDSCELVTFRLAAIIKLDRPTTTEEPAQTQSDHNTRSVYLAGVGFQDISVVNRKSLSPQSDIQGPAVVHQLDATTYLPPFAHARVDDHLNLVIAVDAQAS